MEQSLPGSYRSPAEQLAAARPRSWAMSDGRQTERGRCLDGGADGRLNGKTGPILAPISLGELLDKITILQIKVQQLCGEPRDHVNQELTALVAILGRLDLHLDPALIAELKAVNQALWQIENAIRQQECRQDFGEAFIALARAVYHQNDRRASIKKRINLLYGSTIVEEKVYPSQ